MDDWKQMGWWVIASVGVVLCAGAGGRSAIWADGDGGTSLAVSVAATRQARPQAEVAFRVVANQRQS
ncbi:MAG TPA: hypothetical protein VE779_05740 [Candidatus Angelobacter sp.]|nr:hypothetical protein [Candidatus Angelobacter sp.]